MERKYFTINESSARTAHNMMSMRDYVPNSTTDEYRHLVDAVYQIAEKVAEKRPDEAALHPEKAQIVQSKLNK